MDAASLIVRAGYDGAELTRGLRGSAQEVQRFGAEFRALNPGGAFTKFHLPDIGNETRASVVALRSMGVAIADVHREMQALGVVFDASSNQFKHLGTDTLLQEVEAMEIAAAVIHKLSEEAKGLAQMDAALRSQIGLLTEGARHVTTQAESLTRLRTIYAEVSRELATSNVPLERRIALERELVRIRKEFVAVTAASRPTATADFSSATAGAAGTAVALDKVRAKTDGATRSFAFINKQTGEFTQLGRKASGAAIAVGFGLEAIARGGLAAEGGLRTALRSVASFAAFFGPKGLIVSGVAAATAAIIDMFNKSRDEVKKTSEEFEARVLDMVKAVNVKGLEFELQKLETGELFRNQTTGALEFTRGLNTVNRELADVRRGLLRPFAQEDPGGVLKQRRAIVDLEKERNTLLQQQTALLRTMGELGKVQLPKELPKPIRVEGKSDATLAKEDFEKLKNSVENTVATAKQLTRAIQESASSAGVLARALSPKELGDVYVQQRKVGIELLALHDRISKRLGEEKDKTGEAAVAMRDMLTSMEGIDELQSLMRLRRFLFIKAKLDPVQVRDAVDDVAKVERFFIPVVPVLGGGPMAVMRFVKDLPNIEVPVSLKLFTGDFDLRNFEAAVKRVASFEGELDLAKLGGDAKAIKEAEKNLKRAEKAVQQYALSVSAAIALANGNFAQHAAIMAEIKRITEGLKKGEDSASGLAENLRQITTAGRGLLQTADNLGLIGDNARKALDGVLQLGDAVASLQMPGAFAKISGALGLIGGVGSILQGLGVIGTSPQEEERNRILRSNNEELARLRVELSGFANTIGKRLDLATNVESLQPAIDRFARARPEVDFLGRIDFTEVKTSFAFLMSEMNRLGLDMTELAAIAKQSGIDILDSEGRLIPQAMAQFAAQLRLAAAEAVKFGDTFEEAREAQGLLNRARGIADTGQQQISDAKNLFQQFAPDLFKQFFANIDFGAPAEVRKAIDEFLTAWLGGKVDPELFKDLAPTEVRDIIRTWLDGMDAMADATSAVTSELLNVPAGFKIARHRFEATSPVTLTLNPNVVRAPVPTPPTVTQTLSPADVQQGRLIPASLAALDDAVRGTGLVVIRFGEVLDASARVLPAQARLIADALGATSTQTVQFLDAEARVIADAIRGATSDAAGFLDAQGRDIQRITELMGAEAARFVGVLDVQSRLVPAATEQFIEALRGAAAEAVRLGHTFDGTRADVVANPHVIRAPLLPAPTTTTTPPPVQMTTSNYFGPISINGANKSGEQLFDEIKEIAKRRRSTVSPMLPASSSFDN